MFDNLNVNMVGKSSKAQILFMTFDLACHGVSKIQKREGWAWSLATQSWLTCSLSCNIGCFLASICFCFFSRLFQGTNTSDSKQFKSKSVKQISYNKPKQPCNNCLFFWAVRWGLSRQKFKVKKVPRRVLFLGIHLLLFLFLGTNTSVSQKFKN